MNNEKWLYLHLHVYLYHKISGFSEGRNVILFIFEL